MLHTAKCFSLSRIGAILVSILFSALAGLMTPAGAQSGDESTPVMREVPFPRTDSPRSLLASFIRIRADIEATLNRYINHDTEADLQRLRQAALYMRSMINLSDVAPSDRAQVGDVAYIALLDIFGRVGLPNLDNVPDENSFDADGVAIYTVPRTPLRIVRTEEGERAGEFLFDSRTPRLAPQFLKGIQGLPLRSDVPEIDSWTTFVPQLTGPWISNDFVLSLPDWLQRPWLDTPRWKVAVTIILALAAFAALIGLHRFLHEQETSTEVRSRINMLITPIALLLFMIAVQPVIIGQLLLSGSFLKGANIVSIIVFYGALAWVFWHGFKLFFELVIRSPKIQEGSLDANLLRLLASVLGIIAVSVIFAYAGQFIGLPVFSLLAGLGVGGLAVALSVRPTLENLIGGVILYMDKPVRVGDFCTFGEETGTVESIGIRSTQIRARDRTLISIPNAQFADMKLINWAYCDRMLIQTEIGLRFETTPDQLRYVLAKIREMVYAHPRIDRETVRIRYHGPVASARGIGIRIYALTREWNDFYAIREDIFLRIDLIVEEAGTGYALPSQTLYMRRDEGIDESLQEKAESTVNTWRNTRRLPFPRMPEEHIDRISGTLDYPPKGSPEAAGERLEGVTGAETLSAETPEDGEEKRDTEHGRKDAKKD